MRPNLIVLVALEVEEERLKRKEIILVIKRAFHKQTKRGFIKQTNREGDFYKQKCET